MVQTPYLCLIGAEVHPGTVHIKSLVSINMYCYRTTLQKYHQLFISHITIGFYLCVSVQLYLLDFG